MSQTHQPSVRIYYDGTDITELLELANFLSVSSGELAIRVTSSKPAKKRASTSRVAVTREPTPQPL